MVHTASVIPAAMPGVTVATAWAIQQSDFTETLEANCLLPGPISREGISALRHTYCRTPSPDDRAKRRTPCVFIHAIEGHHRLLWACKIVIAWNGCSPHSLWCKYLDYHELSAILSEDA